MSGFAGSAFAAKKGKGEVDGVTNTMSNSDGNKDNPSTTSSDSSLYTGDPSKTTDNITPTSRDTGGVSTNDLQTFSKCASGAALGDGRLTLADVNDCYGQVFDHGFGQGLSEPSSTHSTDPSKQGFESGTDQPSSTHGSDSSDNS